MKVTLLGTGKLGRAQLATVAKDLGRDDLELTLISWQPPLDPVADVVPNVIVLSGSAAASPAPAAPAPAVPAPAVPAPAAPAPAPAAPAAPPAAPAPARPVSRLRKLVRQFKAGRLAARYWSRLRSRPEALAAATGADLVVVLDSRALRAGWHLARRPSAPQVINGAAAAGRELAAR
ncbi:hypothetical protein [Jiangella sp. DSM 45060]|uniref:hypothetical protein n=1 Tax=Jiangella sp. DSM 45060 TaxID=1798224 RepID=UPI00087AF8B7|nr:hypothetical protein [Jiangella sp. DSM 45060]SDS13331.1 hypothetical protein SAMN04515669_0407 [Jiangella sp. DSM 45060]